MLKKWLKARKQKKINEFNKKRVIQALEGILFIEHWHTRLGWDRKRRKLFWQTFIKEPNVREDEVNKFLRMIKGG